MTTRRDFGFRISDFGLMNRASDRSDQSDGSDQSDPAAFDPESRWATGTRTPEIRNPKSASAKVGHAALVGVLLMLCGGCPVPQEPGVPEQYSQPVERTTGRKFWLYVPSTYDAAKRWPLVVTCHGTKYWDTARQQICEWAALAEQRGFIVAAPDLVGVQADFPPAPAKQIARQQRDERLILGMIDQLEASYSIAEHRIFITGWSGGAYAVLYTGLKNPDVFRALAVRQGTFDERYLVPVEPFMDRHQPVFIFYGAMDTFDQAEACIRWLRERRHTVRYEEVPGGHRRRPEVAFNFFRRVIQEYPLVRVDAEVGPPDRPREVRFAVKAIPPPQKVRWEFGDGQTSDRPAPTHTYAADGTYDVQLTAWLTRGQRAVRKLRIRVPAVRIGPRLD